MGVAGLERTKGSAERYLPLDIDVVGGTVTGPTTGLEAGHIDHLGFAASEGGHGLFKLHRLSPSGEMPFLNVTKPYLCVKWGHCSLAEEKLAKSTYTRFGIS